MLGGQSRTPERGLAHPRLENRSATAAGTSTIPRSQARAKRGGFYTVTLRDGDTFVQHIRGREAWALERLAEAGPIGCTPITEPAPRWSAYVHLLRQRGIPIETLHEPHGGEFSGTHARYILRASVQKVAKP